MSKRHRSSVDGTFVDAETAAANPREHVAETVRPALDAEAEIRRIAEALRAMLEFCERAHYALVQSPDVAPSVKTQLDHTIRELRSSVRAAARA